MACPSDTSLQIEGLSNKPFPAPPFGTSGWGSISTNPLRASALIRDPSRRPLSFHLSNEHDSEIQNLNQMLRRRVIAHLIATAIFTLPFIYLVVSSIAEQTGNIKPIAKFAVYSAYASAAILALLNAIRTLFWYVQKRITLPAQIQERQAMIRRTDCNTMAATVGIIGVMGLLVLGAEFYQLSINNEIS